MAVLASNSFAALIEKSGLLSAEQLQQAKTIIDASNGDSVAAARMLIKQNLLTRWQAEQLLRGRHQLTLGKYVLLDRLGEGGMGHVFLAEHRAMKRRVALKTLSRELSKDPAAMKRLVAEARAIASLDHPNIIRAYDLETEGDLYYIVMEYVEGQDLERLVKARGKLPVREAADFIRQAAAGLAHAHEKKMIHRDIKPANLLVDKQRGVKILDLGLAQLAERTPSAGQPVEGTVDYISPEQAEGSKNIDARADIYSLGCTFYFALCGHAPFPDGSLAQKLTRHQMDEPKPIDQERPDTPGMLVDICRRMMAKQPGERFQTATEVTAALAKWLAQAPTAVPVPPQGIPVANSARAVPVPRRATSARPAGVSESGTIDAASGDTELDFLNETNSGSVAPRRSKPDSSAGKPVAKGAAAKADVKTNGKTADGKPSGSSGVRDAKGTSGKATTGKKDDVKQPGKAKAVKPKGNPNMLPFAIMAVCGIGLTTLGILWAVFHKGDNDLDKEIASKPDKPAATAELEKNDATKPDKEKDPQDKPKENVENKDGVDPVLALKTSGDAKAADDKAKAAKPDGAAVAGANETAKAPADKPAEPPADKPADKPAEKPMDQVASVDAKKPPEAAPKPADKPAAPATAAPKPAAPPPKPQPPKNPFGNFAKSVDLPDLPKSGEAVPETPISLGKIAAPVPSDMAIKFTAPTGAKGKPLLTQFALTRTDASADAPAWQFTAKSGSADAEEVKVATLSIAKDGEAQVSWSADANKVKEIDQLRNCEMKVHAATFDQLLYLRVPKKLEPLVIDLEAKISGKGEFKLQVPLEFPYSPPADLLMLDILKFEPGERVVRSGFTKNSQTPLIVPAKEKEPYFGITVPDKAPQSIFIRVVFSKLQQHQVLELYPQFRLVALGEKSNPPQPLHPNFTTKFAKQLDDQLATYDPQIKAANDKKKTDLAKKYSDEKAVIAAAKKEMEGVVTNFGHMNKNAKLYYRVIAKYDDYLIELMTTGAQPENKK